MPSLSTVMSNVFMSNVFMTRDVMTNAVAPPRKPSFLQKPEASYRIISGFEPHQGHSTNMLRLNSRLSCAWYWSSVAPSPLKA